MLEIEFPEDKLSPEQERVIALLDALTDKERRNIFIQYCHECGRIDREGPGCRCWDDS